MAKQIELNDLTEDELFNILCLFLAQSDEPKTTNLDLGYQSQSDAFVAIGELFKKQPTTVKLTRDAFDRYTDSSRVGWDEPLRVALAKVFADYGQLKRNELLELSKKIIAKKLKNSDSLTSQASFDLFSRIKSADSKTQIKPVYSETIINFSNTTGNWFAATIDQISNSLKDILLNIDEFEKAGRIYKEPNWRSAFKTNLKDEVASALAGTQTFAYFDLLAKIIHYSSSDTQYTAKSIDLDKEKIEIAILEIKNIVESTNNSNYTNSHVKTVRITGGNNKIIYGAPGTGKSYKVNELTSNAGHEVIRTVFHPDVQNSDFIGALKPVMDGADITYKFSPGAFAKALVSAINNPTKHTSLIIEEINRAPAAAVFGELFLLLDRKADGSGEYDADFPSEEFQTWYQEETKSIDTKFSLPSNLSIYATMNSADQGVYPLDTAFRRRWEQEYIDLDYSNAPVGNIIIAKNTTESFIVKWADFIEIINEQLASLPHVQEDRLIGPWFVKSSEIAIDTTIPEKVLIYLWDDLLRHDGKEAIFLEDKFHTYGKLTSAVRKAEPILAADLLNNLEAKKSGTSGNV